MIEIQTGNLVTPEALDKLSADDRENVYNGLDCCVTLEIFNEIETHLDEVSQPIYQLALDMQAPIMEMSMRGLKVDLAKRKEMLSQLESDLVTLEKNFQQICGEVFEWPDINWRSPKQLMELFYERFGFKPIKGRKSNGSWGPTIDRDALEKLAINFYAQPLINHLFALRDTGKKISFLNTAMDADNCIRASFNIAGTKTGRLASSVSELGTGTNLQNIGRNVRPIFVAREGMKYGNLDLEQADARNLGALCWNIFMSDKGYAFAVKYFEGDDDFCKFNRDIFHSLTREEFAGSFLDAAESGDLHTAVAQGAYPHLPWTDDPKKNREIADDANNHAYRNFTYRDQSKRLGHGTNFVGQPATMSMHTKVPKGDIETFQYNYFRKFLCIKVYHAWVREELRVESALTTLLGRRRYFWGRFDDPATLREAVAYSPQSMTGDQINKGLRRIWRANRADICLQVHDSVLFEYNPADEAEIIPWALDQLLVKIPLIAGRTFAVPTEAKIGFNFGDHHPETNPMGLIKWKGPGCDSEKIRHASD